MSNEQQKGDICAQCDETIWRDGTCGCWPLISSYSRAQAIDDGVLVDLGIFTWRGERIIDWHRFKYPVAITSTAFSACCGPHALLAEAPAVEVALAVTALLRDFKAAVQSNSDSDRVHFSHQPQPYSENLPSVKLWAVCGPGDTAEPVLTIMLEGED